MLATVWATYKTLRIAEREFPKIHNLHNKANAFRHALWNILIAKQAFRISSNTDEVLVWTKRITDWHEDFSPNEIMARKMDLHNNAVGRNLFLILTGCKTEHIILSLKNELKKVVIVVEEFDFEKNKSKLVYLED